MRMKKIWAMSVMAFALGTMGTMAVAAESRRDNLWFHMQVHEGKDDSHVMINLPLSVVEKSAHFLPKDSNGRSGKIRFNDEEMNKAELRSIWNDVRRQRDMTFLTVKETDGRVKMAKQGNYLLIHAAEEGARRENVEIRVPLAVVDALLAGDGDELNVRGALEALVRVGEGELMTVTGDNETVRMWIDDRAEAR